MGTPSLIRPVWVWLRRGALDRRLAGGTDPHTSPELSRRARQLTSPHFRDGLAKAVRDLIDAAEAPPAPLSSAVSVQRREVLAERELLLALAAELELDGDLPPRGIVLVERLLSDGESPVYKPSPEGTLHEALTQARDALHLG
jgi:hypothetical protein